MLKEFVQKAKQDEPVYIGDVRRAFTADFQASRVVCQLELLQGGEFRDFTIHLPNPQENGDDEAAFIRSYLSAEIYNLLTTLGGRKIIFYTDPGNVWLKNLLQEIEKDFEITLPRSQRSRYGRVINVIDRIIGALREPGEGVQTGFSFIIENINDRPGAEEITQAGPINKSRLQLAKSNLEESTICGLDVGGTDIKAALSIHGRLEALLEYDWFPASYSTADEIISPILVIVRLLQSLAAVSKSSLPIEEKRSLTEKLHDIIDRGPTPEIMASAVEDTKSKLGNESLGFDAIGLCFPDVVIRNKIVGGEVPKTRGIRSNASVEYEEEFAKLTSLNEDLDKLCREGGVVMNTNDGPMAAFTAAIELSSLSKADQVQDGVFAHTLGTDLGSGWVDGSGTIPEIPLEVYNLIIDLGSFKAREYQAEDVRSVNNTNTHLSGTLQKYTSQSGVFRLAVKRFEKERPDLYEELFDKGFLGKSKNGAITVLQSPEDMRKPLLEHLMGLAEQESKEPTASIFREIGVLLAKAWAETENILESRLKRRILFGRLVKNSKCFRLLQEGAAEIFPELELIAADPDMAGTSLMKQLAEHPRFTVAQFGQAIGAIYFGNLGLAKS